MLIAAGDLRRAGEWLVARYARDVIALCRSMVRERALSEDLAQDVFAQAFAHLGGYRAEAAPRTWLLAIARNRCIDQLRRSDREPWRDADDGLEADHLADDAPLPPELLLRRADVDDALRDLEENERALIVLRFRHGLEYPELASVFGLREGTVRMRLSRALGKMRSRLEARDGQAASLGGSAPEAQGEAAPSRGRGAIEPPVPGAPPPAAARAPSFAPPLASEQAPSARPLSAPSRASRATSGAPAPRAVSWLERLRGFVRSAPEELAPEDTEPQPPTTPFAAALADPDAEPTEGFSRKLEALLAGLP